MTNQEALKESAELAWAFPSVDPGAKPLGGRILVQLRRTKKKTSGSGIILVEETKETEKWQNMVAKVIHVGPLAFKHRDSMQSWPEGSWCQLGDFVRVPKWGGDRWEIDFTDAKGANGKSLFTFFNDHEVIGKVTGDPRAIKAFI
jgi:co-chaperonin GroES (HSP10)